MRLFQPLLLALQLATGLAQQWPIQDNGLNEVVQWDRYSLLVNGERFFLWSGEFHPFRIPVPELWTDIMLKMKAAGFNSISIYLHWGWHSPAEGVNDFETGAHNIRPILEQAKEIGLWVIMRPGPYINAESTGWSSHLSVATGEHSGFFGYSWLTGDFQVEDSPDGLLQANMDRFETMTPATLTPGHRTWKRFPRLSRNTASHRVET